MIEYLEYPKLLISPPAPLMGVKERAVLGCGCCVWVGMRLDKMEAATCAGACGRAHDQLIAHFNLLLAESTVEPTDEELVVVCERLLNQAAQYHAI